MLMAGASHNRHANVNADSVGLLTRLKSKSSFKLKITFLEYQSADFSIGATISE